MPAFDVVRENRSPCTGLCKLDDDDFCRGCRRHIEEIKDWGLLAPEAQRKILDSLPARRAASFSADDGND
ncbi:MAG: DUF1289 domain-containing protein [Moraxellaceae bacterium]